MFIKKSKINEELKLEKNLIIIILLKFRINLFFTKKNFEKLLKKDIENPLLYTTPLTFKFVLLSMFVRQQTLKKIF